MKNSKDNLTIKLKSFSSLKAILILNALSNSEEYSSISYISENTDLSSSTVHRILNEMSSCGLVEKNSKDRTYKLGYESLFLAERLKANNYYIQAAVEDMIKLNNVTKETIHLVTLAGYEGVYIYKLDAQNQVGLRSFVGKKLPLHCTSVGKNLLAYKSEDWLRDYFHNTTLQKYTDTTLSTEQELKQELKIVKEQGYALDALEHHKDIFCIGAPIFDKNGEAVMSLGIAAPFYRFSKETALSYITELKACTASISQKLTNIQNGF